MVSFVGLRCIYPFSTRLCYIIKTKHSETKEISDFLVLIESYIHCLALRRQNEPSIVALQAYVTYILLHTLDVVKLTLRLIC